MTTENLNPTTEPETPPEAPPPEAPPAPGQSPKELQEFAKRKGDEAKSMRQELMQERLEKVGLNHESGVGKAIYNHYDGDVSVEALASYAESEYGHKKPEGTQTPEQKAQTTASQKADELAGQTQVTTPSQAVDEAAAIAGQMLAPDPEQGLARPVIESSIGSKISNWLNPPK